MENVSIKAILAISAMFLIMPLLSFAQESLPLEPLMPGAVEGTGTYFEITNSEYLNISLQSTKEILLTLESIPKTINLLLGPSTSTNSTVLTIGNLEPHKTYYKFQDSYKNEAVFISDGQGSYTWTQDLITHHHIWFQESGGTVFLPEDCDAYGDWDEGSRTCALTQDLTESVEILENNITLDCNIHSITSADSGFGIYLYNKSETVIKNCTVAHFSYGIYLVLSYGNTVFNNNVRENTMGISFSSSYYLSSPGNIIAENRVSLNLYDGINLQSSIGNNIAGNIISGNKRIGLLLSDSPNSYLRNNQIAGNKYNFGSWGPFLGNVQDIDTSNTVNGKPIYYLVNEEDKTIDSSSNAGYIGAINSRNITIKEAILSNNVQGIFFDGTTDSRVENSTITENMYGLEINRSSHNQIIGNNISENELGIRSWISSYTTVADNDFSSDSFYLTGSSDTWSHDSKVYHNNFKNNPQPRVDRSYNDLFDNGYPQGGNYWSDYTGQDQYSGPDQDQPGSDKVGDTPYTFTGGQDRYPFVQENGWLTGPPQEFWAEIKNADILRIREAPSLMAAITKILPADWVVHVLNTTTTAIDGYYWYKIQDATDGSAGFMAGKDAMGTEYLPYDPNKQTEFREKASYQLTTKTERADKIIESVDHYYNNVSTMPSLYSSNNGANYLSIFKENNFPEELILAIAAQESWLEITNFDNEWLSSDYGHGIMQLTFSTNPLKLWDNRGIGSGLKILPCGLLDQNYKNCYSPPDWQNYGKRIYVVNPNYNQVFKYYTNTSQSIYSNIKDGLRVLQEKYQYQSAKSVATTTIDNLVITTDDLQKILTTWRYNGFTEGTYLSSTSDKLGRLSSYFPGITYSDADKLIEKMTVVNKHQERFLAYSPINLYVIDSAGRITGLTSTGVKEEIPNSGYDTDTGIGVLLFPDYSHQYEVVGTANGTFGLTIDSVINDAPIAFNAIDIPITTNEVQIYSIDWQKLSQGQNGVTIQIDTNGDGIFDEFITAGNELTDDDIILQTQTSLNFDPNTLNLKSKGNSVTAYIELSQGFDAKQINVSSIMLNDPVPALSKPTAIGDYNHNGIFDLMVKFNRQAVQNILTSGDQVKVTVSGKLNNGRLFKGDDTIKVISFGKSPINVALASVDGDNISSLIAIWERIQTFINTLFHWFWSKASLLISPDQPLVVTPTPPVSPTATSSPVGPFSFNWITEGETGTGNEFVNPKSSSIPKELNAVLLKDIPIATDACTGNGHTQIIPGDGYSAWSIDLNDDGVNEFFIFPVQVCGWFIPGASGNGPFYVYQEINGLWKKIGNLGGNGFAVEEEKVGGFKNIVTRWHLSAVGGEIKYYQWNKDKSEYEFVKQENY